MEANIQGIANLNMVNIPGMPGPDLTWDYSKERRQQATSNDTPVSLVTIICLNSIRELATSRGK